MTHLAIIPFPLVVHNVVEDFQEFFGDERDRALADILPDRCAVEK